MKPKTSFLTLALGLILTSFACQDQSVVAPDDAMVPDDLVAAFGKPDCTDPDSTHPKCQDDDPQPGDDPTLELGGLLVGFSSTDVTWKSKKGIFSMHAPFDPKIQYTGGALNLADCKTQGPRGSELLAAFMAGEFEGKVSNIFVDEGMEGLESPEHRVFVLVEGVTVRYYWIGPRYTVGEDLLSDATFTDISIDGGPTKYELTGGVIGMRDTRPPSSHTQVACPYTGTVTVTLTR